MHFQTCKINWVRWPTTWNCPEMLVASTAARTDVDSVVGREPAGVASFWKPLQQHPLALQWLRIYYSNIFTKNVIPGLESNRTVVAWNDLDANTLQLLFAWKHPSDKHPKKEEKEKSRDKIWYVNTYVYFTVRFNNSTYHANQNSIV